MDIYEALDNLRQGKIARCKHSYFMLDEDGYLVRLAKNGNIIGIATITGDVFATHDWEVMNKEELTKEKLRWKML